MVGDQEYTLWCKFWMLCQVNELGDMDMEEISKAYIDTCMIDKAKFSCNFQ